MTVPEAIERQRKRNQRYVNNHGQNGYSRAIDEEIIAVSLLYNQMVDYEKIFKQITDNIEIFNRHPEIPKEQLVTMIESYVKDRQIQDSIRRRQLERNI